MTSLGLVQMTRKRVGQGLIEAFSTTCESCGGRGIHVHMEPVNKKSLDREITPTHDFAAEAQDSETESNNEHDQAESAAPAEESSSEQPEKKSGFSRKRRRAASSGVVTA